MAAFVKACFLYADPNYGETTLFGIGSVFLLGVGSLVVGLVLMVVWNVVRPDYFRGETLPKRADLVLSAANPHQQLALRLPDSASGGTVIAADLSNLPSGTEAVDPSTGQRFRRVGRDSVKSQEDQNPR